MKASYGRGREDSHPIATEQRTAMHLDMQTMSAVNVAVTAILGLVLVFTWARERECAFVGWWGLALLAQSAGVVMAAMASTQEADDLLAIGTATIILADAVKWMAARQFSNRRASLIFVFLGLVGFLLAAKLGHLGSFDGRLGAVCTILSLYNVAAASELARANGERLASRWPAVSSSSSLAWAISPGCPSI
jgi:hypothetical protein